MSGSCVEMSPVKNPNACIIWLHGLGGNGQQVAPVIPLLNLPKELKIKFVFPNAPTRRVTLNGGIEMTAWFDVRFLNRVNRPDLKGLKGASELLETFIKAEIEKGMAPERIIIGGFSQGGTVALYNAIHSKLELGGVACLSGYLLDHDSLSERAQANSLGIPVFLAHGDKDKLVDKSYSDHSNTILKELGYKVTYNNYDLGHSVSQEEAGDLGAWIAGILK